MDLFTLKLIDFLPPESRAKAIALDVDRLAVIAVFRDIDNRLQDDRERLAQTLRGASFQRDNLGPRFSNDADTLARINAPVERINTEIDGLRVPYSRAQDRLREYDFLVNAVGWLNEMRKAGVAFRNSTPPATKGDNSNTVAEARQKLDQLSINWRNTENAPRPAAAAVAALFAEIDQLADRGRPDVDLRTRDRSPIHVEAIFGIRGKTDGYRALAHSMIWLMRDEIKGKLSALIGDEDAPGSLSNDARDKTFERISAQRLSIERVEEAAICAAAAIGLAIPRRQDCDPRALLEIEEI